MKQGHKLLPRILITLLGVAFFLMGTTEIILGFAGERVYGVITDIHREGGERSDGNPGRYTYSISYTFTLPDGNSIDGFTKRIGDSIYTKATGTSIVPIRYFTFFPHINAMEQDTGIGTRQPILMITGVFLIFMMNRKR